MGDVQTMSVSQEPWEEDTHADEIKDAMNNHGQSKPKKEKKPKTIKQVKRHPLSAKKAKKFLDSPLTPVKLIWEQENTPYYVVQFPKDQHETFAPLISEIPSAQFMHETVVDPQGLGRTDPDVVVFVERWQIHQSDETMQKLSEFGRKFKFAFDGDLLVRAQMQSDEGKKLLAMSSAKSTTLLKLPTFPKVKVGKKLTQLKAYPFQVAGIAYALKAKRCFIADEMGLGKTIQAIGTNAVVKKFPMLCIVPNTLKINWKEECQKWFGKKRSVVMLRNKDLKPLNKRISRKHREESSVSEPVTEEVISDLAKKRYIKKGLKFLKQYDVIVVNYDKLNKWSDYFVALKPPFVVFDESHYVKGNSTRTRVCKAMMDAISPEYLLMLTGTPIMNKPLELIRQLQIMGRMAEFGGVDFFIRRYCSIVNVDMSQLPSLPKPNEVGSMPELTEEQKLAVEMREELLKKVYENQIELNHRLRSVCYVRREKSDVLTDLPEKQRSMLTFEISNREEYERIEEDVIGYLGDKAAKDQKFLKGLRKLSKEEQVKRIKERRNTKMERVARAEILVKIEALKQAAAIGKLDSIKEWIEDFFESSPKKKLVVFATHRRIIDELELILSDYNPVAVRGGDSDIKRDNAVKSFQNDKKTKLFIGSLRAAGVGLTLTSASDVVFTELGWTPAVHDQAEDRCHRITQKNAVTAYYLLGENTIEMKIAKLIESKRQTVDAVSFGDPLEKVRQTGSILGDLVKELLGGKESLL